jgi:hypothetical protein
MNMERDCKSHFIGIPRGSIINVHAYTGALGPVETEWEGKTLSILSRDIDERTERLKAVQGHETSGRSRSSEH